MLTRIEERSAEPDRELKLEIAVTNFGPISKGVIDLKPCTILLGPNNSGKSYFSMLLHSVFGAVEFPELKLLKFKEKIDIEGMWKNFPDIKEKIASLEEGDEYEIPNSLIDLLNHKIFDGIFNERLSQEIVRSYACPLRELVAINRDSFLLKINFNSSPILLELKKNSLKIKKYPEINFKIRITVTGKYNEMLKVNHDNKKNEYQIEIDREMLKQERHDIELIFSDIILDCCKKSSFKNITIPCYYLPAARSGILQGHKALASSIVRRAPYAGIERFEIPKFSGVVSDFISSLMELSEDKGAFFKLAEEFEKELIKGKVSVKTAEKYMYPDIKYYFKDKEIPLHRSSSTVSELAPLFLYLKYRVEPGSLLIIEEPEAHLHPENQRILAKFLVRLIRQGVRLFITTHSEYLIEQLSSFIMLSQFKDEKQIKKLKYDKQDYLNTNEIGVYVFRFDRQSDGYQIEKVEIDEDEGISSEEFLKVHEALYEESIRIQEDLQENK
jgi:predicted ATPase